MRGWLSRCWDSGSAPQTDPPAAEGLCATLVVVLAIALFPFGASGVVRHLTGLGFGSGLAIGLALVAVFIFFARRRFRPRLGRPSELVPQIIVLLALSVLVVAPMYVSAYEGMPGMGGGDGGVHAYQQLVFVNNNPKDYYWGFVLFYSLVHWLRELFGIETFEAYRLLTYLTFLAIMVALAAATFAHVRSGDTAIVRLSHALLPLLSFPVLWWVIFPALHYYQADGYFTQLVGFLPPLAAWIGWGVIDHPVVRSIFIVSLIALSRYSFGLNLGDLILTGGALIFAEAFPSTRGRRMRIAFATAGLAMVAFAFYVYIKMRAAIVGPGSILPIDFNKTAVGLGCTSVALLLAPTVCRLLHAPLSARGSRLTYFAGLLAFITFGVHVALLVSKQPILYYAFKYGFYATLIAQFALCALMAERIARGLLLPVPRLWRRLRAQAVIPAETQAVLQEPISSTSPPTHRRFAGATWLTTVLALVVIAGSVAGPVWHARGYANFQGSFRDRVRRQMHWPQFKPLADREALRTIRNVLANTGKQFGGAVAHVWPLSSFMNGAFGHDPMVFLIRTGRVNTTPGHCVFWYADPMSLVFLDREGSGAAVRRLHAQPGRACWTYDAPWEPSHRLEFCYRCY